MTTSVKVSNLSGSWYVIKVELVYTKDGLPVQKPVYLDSGKSAEFFIYSETHIKVTEQKP